MESHERRTMLQFFLQDRIRTMEEFTKLIERICGNGPKNVDSVLNSINSDIEEFSQKLIKSTCEVTGDRQIILVSTADQAQMKSSLSKEHLDYFYHLIDKIITSNGSLAFIAALNLAPAVTMGKLKMIEAEKALELMVSKRLLVICGGHLFLSSITIAELGSFINDNYEVVSCSLCKKLALYGDKCIGCDAPFHLHCIKEFFELQKTPKCPLCKREAPSSSFSLEN